MQDAASKYHNIVCGWVVTDEKKAVEVALTILAHCLIPPLMGIDETSVLMQNINFGILEANILSQFL